MQIQQGDVLFERMGEAATTAAASRGAIVLAKGEATGHAHTIPGDCAAVVEEMSDDVKIIDVCIETTVRHEEHAPVTLPPGRWKVWRVREYDWFSERAFPVKD